MKKNCVEKKKQQILFLCVKNINFKYVWKKYGVYILTNKNFD